MAKLSSTESHLLDLVVQWPKIYNKPISFLQILRETGLPPQTLRTSLMTLTRQQRVTAEFATNAKKVLISPFWPDPHKSQKLIHGFFHDTILKQGGDLSSSPSRAVMDALAHNSKSNRTLEPALALSESRKEATYFISSIPVLSYMPYSLSREPLRRANPLPVLYAYH